MPPRPEPSFLLIIQLHYLQAMLQMGAIPNPATGQANPMDEEAARHELRLLEILREKTQGNLQPDEQQMLDQVIEAISKALEAL